MRHSHRLRRATRVSVPGAGTREVGRVPVLCEITVTMRPHDASDVRETVLLVGRRHLIDGERACQVTFTATERGVWKSLMRLYLAADPTQIVFEHEYQTAIDLCPGESYEFTVNLGDPGPGLIAWRLEDWAS